MKPVGTVIIDVKADTAKLVSGMDRAESTIKRSVSNIQKTILTLATAYAGIQGVRAFKNMIDDSLDAADATGKLAQKLGLTTDALSEYQYTAKFAAVSSGELNAGLSALVRRLSNFQRTGGGAAKTAFQELGISAEYARKHFTSTDIAFKEILKRLEKMPDGFRKTAIAQDIFSKSASSIMRITSSDLQKFSEEAKKIGISISQSTYEMAAAYHDQMDQIDARMQGFKQTVSFSMIAPLDAASKTALTFMDDAFGSDATSRVKGFENITVTAISNIVYSLGFIKDVGTGIELVLDGIKLAFYSLAAVAAVAIEPVRVMINNMIDAYNYLADSLGQDKIGFKLESSLPDIANKIISIKDEMIQLTGELQNGRISAEEYTKKFKENLAKVKEEAKHTKKAISRTANIPENPAINNQLQKTYEMFVNITGTDYDKWLQSTNDKMAKLAADGSLSAQQLQQAWDSMQSDYEINLSINGLDDIQSKFDDMIDSQISLASGVNDWGNNLTGVSKNFANVAKSMNAFKVNDLKFDKTAHKLKTKYAKDSLKIEKSKIPAEQKVLKQKELAANFDKDYSQAKNQQFSNELNAYSNLAGAIGSFYEAGSTAAKAAQAVQATLGIVNGYGAITQAWASAPFPANLPGVAAATAAVLPMIAQLTSLGGSGGGGSSGGGAGKVAGTESRINTITNESTVIIDELKRQTALLEAINLHGSSESLKVKSSQVTFESEYKLWIEKTLQNVAQGGWTQLDAKSLTVAVEKLEKNLGFDVYKQNNYHGRKGDNLYINGGSMRQGDNLLKTITESLKENFTGILGIGSDYKNLKFAAQEAKTAALMQDINSLQNTISDWALSVIDSMNSLSDASDDFKDSFDKVTGSMYYENKKLADAYRDVNIATNGGKLDDYLQATITNIDSLNTFFTDDNLSLLLSSNIDDIPAQIEKVKELSAITGQSFENGAKDALDYLDSINLVSEAMATSRENIKSFEDSFKTDKQLLQDKADKLGIKTIATTETQLMSLFDSLKGGLGGLTDAELDFLNANKDVVEARKDEIKQMQEDSINAQIDKLNETLSNLSSEISTMDSIGDKLKSIVAKINGAALGSVYTMQQYTDAMSSALNASLSDAKTYQELVNDAINKASVLFDSNNYQTSRDQQFAQLVAANQFEGMQDSAMTQIDYLKEIEKNTKDTVSRLTEQLTALGLSITGLDETLSDPKATSSATTTSPTIAQSMVNFSNSFSDNVVADALSQGNYNVGVTKQSGFSSVDEVFKETLGRLPVTKEGKDFWQSKVDDSGWTYDEVASAVSKSDEAIIRGIIPFADGGIVTSPTLSLIGEAGYNEAVIPLKDSNDPLQTKELVSAIKDLTAIVLQQAEDGRESRKLSEDQLLTLLDIEEKIA